MVMVRRKSDRCQLKSVNCCLQKIVHGDCRKILKTFPDCSVDLIVTDPPYGIGFKNWDKDVPSVEVWRECLRVLKPGAFAFIMSGARADVLSQNIIRLNTAGFRTDFTPILWTFSTGFPKSLNISKAVDRKLGCEREVVATVKKKPLARLWAEGKTTMDITKSASDEAKRLEGSYAGFQPKPAFEFILVVMKPLSEKTYVEQALATGKGVTWLDDCRVPIVNQKDVEEYDFNRRGYHERYKGDNTPFEGGWKKGVVEVDVVKGRFPSNLLVSDDVLNDGKNHYSCQNNNPELKKFNLDVNPAFPPMENRSPYLYGDEGSFSRFFSLDFWFEKQFKKLPLGVQKTFPFLIVPKACKSERNKGLEKLSEGIHDHGNLGNCEGFERFATKAKNIHPTVKPLMLMNYLITLGSRVKDLVVDPFCGSGTTVLAAKMLGRRCIGIERSKEYVEIANARLNSFHTLDYFFAEAEDGGA